MCTDTAVSLHQASVPHMQSLVIRLQDGRRVTSARKTLKTDGVAGRLLLRMSRAVN